MCSNFYGGNYMVFGNGFRSRLVFVGLPWPLEHFLESLPRRHVEGWGAMDMRRELKGLTWSVG